MTLLTALQKACDDIPSLEHEIAAGNFKPLRDWLKVKIHQVGSLHPNGDELMKAVTAVFENKVYSPLQAVKPCSKLYR